ncbi:MAG: glycine cleavage T C-terminal barrel domain-containing protein, partial [Acidimicrobiia bacterium]
TEESLIVIPNAANVGAVRRVLEEAAEKHGGAVELRDVTSARALVAAQGRQALTRLFRIAPELPRVGHFEVASTSFGALAGTGYTGEPGVELHIDADEALQWWGRLIDGGFTPAGLGARDTLRLEMGYPLHGSDLGAGITPLQAGLSWTVGWDKESFVGREALVDERQRGVTRRLRGVLLDGRQVPRHGCRVLADGAAVGEVTSGNLSPSLERGVALALLTPAISEGTRVDVDIRGRLAPGRVVRLPFVRTATAESESTTGIAEAGAPDLPG